MIVIEMKNTGTSELMYDDRMALSGFAMRYRLIRTETRSIDAIIPAA